MYCKRILLFLSVFNVFLAYYVYVHVFPIPDEFYYNTTQFIRKYGYGVEEHEIHTDDGSNVTIFRLLPKDGKISRKPFLLLGGIFCNSNVHAMYGPGRDLAYSIVDAGFDVWLLNDRGTIYGTPGTKPFVEGYEYSYHEIGLNELRSSIDYALQKTGVTRVAVAGISAGSASILVLLSQKPEYNEKISVSLHFGSAISLNTKDSLIFSFVGHSVATFPQLVRFSRLASYYEARAFVVHLLFLLPLGLHASATKLFGRNLNDLSTHLLVTHGISDNCYGGIAHLMQNNAAQDFYMRDYGADTNLRLYNSTKPPLYDLSKVTVPSKAYYSEFDSIVDNVHSRRVFPRLNNNLGEYIARSPFNHFNFISDCTGGSEHVTDDIINILKQANFK